VSKAELLTVTVTRRQNWGITERPWLWAAAKRPLLMSSCDVYIF